MVNVLREILQWSLERPPWQRDALRRLVTAGALDNQDIIELSHEVGNPSVVTGTSPMATRCAAPVGELCKSRHGLADKTQPIPLGAPHLPQPGANVPPVELRSLVHHAGVNALAPDQTVEFGPHLTVVYGANAAGKSGYTRILKRACRARGAEEILGNVVAGVAPVRPSATIGFRIGRDSDARRWNDGSSSDPALSRISVFDRHCASVYISQRTDVAFRPLGLDLFDKLSGACEAVRKTLERERNQLESERPPTLDVAQGTAVHDLISNLTSLTDPGRVRELASASDAQKARIQELRTRIRDLESDDPARVARTIELRANRIRSLVKRANQAAELLSDTSINEAFAARDRTHGTRRVVESLQRATFGEQPLSNTGSSAWRSLWEAAARFSTVDAYPSHEFPNTEEGALCVLCQQELVGNGAQRLRRFKDFLDSTAQGEHDAAVGRFNEKLHALDTLVILDDAALEVVSEIQIDRAELAESVEVFIRTAEDRRQVVQAALSDTLERPQDVPASTFDVGVLSTHVENLEQRVSELRQPDQTAATGKLKRELRELEAREELAGNMESVLYAIERKKRIAAYQLCLEETRTNAITRKSSDVTKRAVTEQLAARFADELEGLRFRHVEVQMVDSGGSRGALYHKLQLRRAPGVDVSKIVSEGEARCLSIASFFAELCTAADRSAILFDDPVSSLDHEWRERVARRLVVEAQDRQVIVFTHDIVFLLALSQEAGGLGVDLKHQYLRRDRAGAGLSSSRLPWAAMKVRDRIGHLKELWQAAEKTYRREGRGEYERKAQYMYGLLREAWERAFEEVLLGGTVERYRSSVQTQHVKQLADIDANDCGVLDAGMQKCSRWLPGHDLAAAENAPFPDPEELMEDITRLEDWVKAIRNRRK